VSGPDEPLERRLADHEWGGGAPEAWGPRHDYRESLLQRRLPGPQAAPRALNAGCGAGSMTLKLVDAGYAVTSLDASTGYIEELARTLTARGIADQAPALVGDVTAMPFADGSFDLAVCAEVLEHVDDDEAGARELARVLAPGGRLAGSVPANPWRYDWTDNWAGHRRRYTEAGLEALLRGAGFQDVDVTAWGFPLTGLYHRQVYRRMMRRRLSGPARSPAAAEPRGSRIAARVARAAFELDTLFLGRRPGYLGYLFTARAPLGSRP
jgi:SAM-dependent methyltransferase